MGVYTTKRGSFYKKFSFVAEIQGVASAYFATCSGLEAEVAVVEQWEGGALAADKSPGRVTFPNITLTRGATADEDLWKWFQQVVDADAMVSDPDHERSLDIVELDRKQNELRRWTVVRAWPRRFKAGEWDGGADENTINELELAYHYFVKGGDAASP